MPSFGVILFISYSIYTVVLQRIVRTTPLVKYVCECVRKRVDSDDDGIPRLRCIASRHLFPPFTFTGPSKRRSPFEVP